MFLLSLVRSFPRFIRIEKEVISTAVQKIRVIPNCEPESVYPADFSVLEGYMVDSCLNPPEDTVNSILFQRALGVQTKGGFSASTLYTLTYSYSTPNNTTIFLKVVAFSRELTTACPGPLDVRCRRQGVVIDSRRDIINSVVISDSFEVYIST